MASPFKAIGQALKQPHVYWPIVILLAGVLVAVGSYFVIGRWLDAIIIALALAIIALMVVVLRSFFAMEKEDRLGRGLDDEGPQTAAQQAASESVEQGFRRAVEEIRSSRLGAGGIDALPWLLMLGESGEGKTAAVRESGLELPAEYASRVSGAPTQSCDWWLTNEAIILDLAGRYLGCDDDETRAEWRALLRLLRRQRPGCALNGIVFTISVDSLLGRSERELDDVARSLRRRVNEVTDELGVDLPLYVAVTKVDHLEGFIECVNASPLLQPQGALGWTNDQRVLADPEERVVECLAASVERLEGILPELILRDPDLAHRRRLFAFPQEFEQTIRAVGCFISRAFAATPYDVPPYLRGVYFTSARREGLTVSPQLHRLGQDWARNRVEGSTAPGGIMLGDLFHEIIVGDRDLALPIDRFGQRARLALNVAAGFAVGLLALWWVVSFSSNFLGIRRLQHEATAVVQGASSLSALDAMRDVIEQESGDMRVLRRGGLGGSMEAALARARQTYTWGFGREFEVMTKRKLASVVKGFDAGAFEALAQLASDVSWLARRADETLAARPELARYAPISGNQTDVEAFGRGYDAFVRWSEHSEVQRRIDQEREAVAGAAARLLELKRLEAWAESSRAYPPVRYADVGLPGAEQSSTQVSGAYTQRAWDGLVVRLLEAIDSTGTASGKAKLFQQTYMRRYDEQWRQFLIDTPTPVQRHADVKSSPYLDLVEQIHRNTSVELPRSEAPPTWIGALREARREEPLETEQPKAREEAEQAGGEKPKPPPPPWRVYQEALIPLAADTETAMADGEAAVALALQMANRQGTSFEKALKGVGQLVPAEGDPEAAAKLEAILAMPILDAASAVIGRAFEQLDGQWRRRLVEPYSGRLTSSTIAQLYGRTGEAAGFRTGELTAFYQDGRAVHIIGDRGMPFGRGFLRWMKSAERLQRVLGAGSLAAGGKLVARLQGVPARVDGRKGLRVAEREIRLRCDDGIQIFKYTEGMGQYTFKWSPDCDELTLRITVLESGRRRELAPVKEWKGPMALPRFLQQAKRSGNDLRWVIRYAEAAVSVVMSYRLREGEELLAMKHESPPKSMGN